MTIVRLGMHVAQKTLRRLDTKDIIDMTRLIDDSTYADPALRARLKENSMSGDKGGVPGQWSARKAQLVART